MIFNSTEQSIIQSAVQIVCDSSAKNKHVSLFIDTLSNIQGHFFTRRTCQGQSRSIYKKNTCKRPQFI